jgi:hypothetical protein
MRCYIILEISYKILGYRLIKNTYNFKYEKKWLATILTSRLEQIIAQKYL